MKDFMFTLWDVEHGLSIWIQTPSGQNHCIDAGKNNDTDFSPYVHMRISHNVKMLDYLIISHPDKDHIEGLPDLVKNLGYPRVLSRNRTLPDQDKYGDCKSEYLETFKYLDTTYIAPVDESNSPLNPLINGDVLIHSFHNIYRDGMSKNNTSMVVFYKFNNHLFVMPGDIEPDGWSILRQNYIDIIQIIKRGTKSITLVAPHHGRPSAYSQEMIDDLSPDIILISDKFAKHETDTRYYSAGTGFFVYSQDKYSGYKAQGQLRSLSTKTKGRIRININQSGLYTINYDNTDFILFSRFKDMGK